MYSWMGVSHCRQRIVVIHKYSGLNSTRFGLFSFSLVLKSTVAYIIMMWLILIDWFFGLASSDNDDDDDKMA